MVAVGGERRPAINAHAPSEIRFESVRLAPDARLSFAVGIGDAKQGKGGDGVRFVVRVEDRSGAPVEVWSRRVGAEERGWIDAEVELEAFAGSRVNLILATEELANARADFSAWGEPVLRSAGYRMDLRDFPILRKVNIR
ncbi:MAG: hypothetical protein V3T72_15115, partial [Thermoanaerobaculia bacterium]